MTALTKKEVLEDFDNAKDTDLFCAFCYEKLTPSEKKGTLDCPNGWCDNKRKYNLKGEEL